MPAIDAAMPTPVATTAEARPASQNAGKAAKAGESDVPSNDAFVAALLAQSMAPTATPDTPAPTGESGALPVTGQELPTLRPALAAATTPRRALAPVVTDAPPAEAAPVDPSQDEFATAFVALQDAMTGGAGGERGAQTSTNASTSSNSDDAGLTTSGLLSDLGAATASAPARSDSNVSQALDALTGAQAARAHEAPAPAQAYAAKPAPLPMDQPALFAERLNQHISFMIGDQIQTAQIAVTPADLGPVEVRVTMVGDEAKIQLTATHAATREALNEALPRLRASFAEAGIQLSQAGVFAQMPERQQADPSFSAQPRGSESDFEPAPLASVAPARNLRVGLIDAFV